MTRWKAAALRILALRLGGRGASTIDRKGEHGLSPRVRPPPPDRAGHADTRARQAKREEARDARRLLARVLFGLAVSKAAPVHASPFDDGAYLHPHKAVTVAAARRLDLFCLGAGSPPVLFVAGLGDDMTTWRRVQPVVARRTRSCAYDRAGYGFSDPSSRGGDLDAGVRDLHALVAAGFGRRPVLLVAHSLGALFAVEFARRHAEEVAGLILVEPAFSGQQRAFAKGYIARRLQLAALKDAAVLNQLDTCLRHLKARALSVAVDPTCPTGPDAAEPDLRDELRRRWRRPKTIAAVRAEYAAGVAAGPDRRTLDDREAEGPPLDLGHKPVIVLTATDRPPQPDLDAAAQATHDHAWRAGHLALAARSSVGMRINVPGSGHFVQLDKPDQVTAAVLKALQLVATQR